MFFVDLQGFVSNATGWYFATARGWFNATLHCLLRSTRRFSLPTVRV